MKLESRQPKLKQLEALEAQSYFVFLWARPDLKRNGSETARLPQLNCDATEHSDACHAGLGVP